MKKFFSCAALLLLLGMTMLHAQTTLVAGDIAILGYNYVNPDELRMVALVDIAAGTTVYITDNGWTGSALTTSEGTHTHTFSSAVTKGTVISVTPSSVAFSQSGDQIFIYRGTAAAPVFIAGISTKPWITSGTVASTTSYRPSSLTNGTHCIAFASEMDGGNYNVTANTGDRTSFLSSIYNSTKWTLTNTRIATFPAWTFSFTGGGGGTAEPTASPTNLTGTNKFSYKFTVNWTAASPAPTGGYLVLWRKGAAPTAVPADGTSYAVGNTVGDAKVAYIGTGTTFLMQGRIEANTTYYFRVFSYNGTGTATNYRTSSYLSGSIASNGSGAGTYYSGINTSSTSFLTNLQTLVRSPYTKVSYDLFDETNVANFAYGDTTGGQKYVECVYSGYRFLYTPPFAWGTFSREHTWCHSWMPSYSSTSTNEYADQHHLFPTQQNNANGVRSNHPLGVVTNVTSSFYAGEYGTDASGNTVYEPRDAQKGDAARALLYMALRYHGVNSLNWSFNYLNNTTLPGLSEDPQNLATLLAWHTQDPPSNYEIARNDYIQSIQGNRNPFIDNPSYVNYINFATMTLASSFANETTDVEEVLPAFTLFVNPNPVQDRAMVSVEATAFTETTLTVTDLSGRVMEYLPVVLEAGYNAFELDASTWASGVYLLRIETTGKVIKFIKQ